ncbi:hypothetical protein KQX54_007554 [Cotesia glomerata]|uniref:Uncharacterized protein n=1 Tax=Cotesia glomerata TaxID=32391 RepID=A0AAV7J211_COTGL|nr:hypothetical protein KQX54_007554 [Cotesia glomerata]
MYLNVEREAIASTPQQLQDNLTTGTIPMEIFKIQSSTSESQDVNMDTHDVTSETVSPIVDESLQLHDVSQIKIGETNDVYCNNSSVPAPQKKSACIFCGSYTKRSGKKQLNVIYSRDQSTIDIDNMIEASKVFNDIRLQSKLRNQKIITYHAVCFSTYLIKFKRQFTDCVDDSEWHNNRDLHKKAFNAIGNFIEENIIKMKKVFYLTQLLSRYKASLLEFGEGKVSLADFESYRAEHLEKKILTIFGDRITIEASTGPLRKKIVYSDDCNL